MNEQIKSDAARWAGQELLGPLYWSFCAKLDVYQAAYASRDASALYVARGGLRLREMYDVYLKKTGRQPTIPQHDLYLSRLAACKGCLARNFEPVAPILCREFYGASLTEMIRAVMPALREHSEPALVEALPRELKGAKADVASFAALYHADAPLGREMRAMFEEQGALFEDYMALLMAQENLLVDTGWSGTAQLMLARHFKDRKWTGLYVGKWNTRGEHLPQFPYMSGLLVDQTTLRYGAQGGALFEYHHIVESPLELAIQSTEGYQRDEAGGAVPWPNVTEDPRLGQGDDAHWQGVMTYFDTVETDIPIDEVERRKERALRRLSRKIRFPSRMDIEALLVPPRSADFGKTLRVPVMLEKDAAPFSQQIWRIRHALWRQGQIKREFPVLAPFICACYTAIRLSPRLARAVEQLILRYLAYAYQRRSR
ncbi:MAG: hypothetical protein EOM37_02810 [Proteobacteria bacterium]|nr:hypothetical protein [Pseudomonadota bacterium]